MNEVQNEYYKSIRKHSIWLVIIGLALTIGLVVMLGQEWIEIGLPFIKISASFAIWYYVDKYMLKSKDTIYEIFDNKNVAVAILVGMLFIGFILAFSKF